MPPCATRTPPRVWPALVWRLSRLTPLTTILCWSGRVRRTSPCLPLSLPAVTITGSPGARSSQRRLGSGLFFSIGFWLQDLRGERDDLHEVALAQLARDGPEDAGAARVVGRGEKDGRVLVEADQRAVRALVFLLYPHHHRLNHLAFLDLAAGLGGLDGGRDDVAHAALVLLVVDLEAGALLDGLAVEAVGFARADLDDDRLVHLVGDDHAEADLAAAPGRVILSLLSWACCGVGHHSAASSFFLARPRLGLALGASSSTTSSSA